jgi:hypothetical protein
LLAEQRLADAGRAFDLPHGKLLIAHGEDQLEPHRMRQDAQQFDQIVVDERLAGHRAVTSFASV